MCFISSILTYFASSPVNRNNFRSLDVVVHRVSEAQLQVNGNFNCVILGFRCATITYCISQLRERDVAQWLERGALQLSLPGVRV